VFVGDRIAAPEGILDLNNLYGMNGASLNVTGGERIVLRVYRGTGLSTLVHYRRVPDNGNMVQVIEPEKGFFADFNLDGKVDDADFTEFRNRYRTHADDMFYNPDFDVLDDGEGSVDVKDFAKFSKEYGRTDVR
jgi:hypothetical protein